MKALLRLGLLVVCVIIVSGCAAIVEAHKRSFAAPSDPSLVLLGAVSTGGGGLMPPQSVLRDTLREAAARKFSVPVEEIVLGPLEIGGSEELGEETEYANVGVATVALRPRPRGNGSWQASAEASRRIPKQS